MTTPLRFARSHVLTCAVFGAEHRIGLYGLAALAAQPAIDARRAQLVKLALY